MIEKWEIIEGFEDYHISNMGNVKSTKYGKERILKYSLNSKGYPTVNFIVSKFRKGFNVHVLVALYFLDTPSLERTQVNHKDGIKTNNKYSNLEWSTPSENMKHAFDLKLNVASKYLGEDNGNSVLTEPDILDIRETYKNEKITQQELADIYECSRRTIGNVINRVSWKHI